MLLVEVDSVEKGCPVIIDLDKIYEIAPLREGGCALFFSRDPFVDPSKASMAVKNSYDQFKQFVVQTISPEDISRKIESFKVVEPKPVVTPITIDNEPVAVKEQTTTTPRKPGRPPKSPE